MTFLRDTQTWYWLATGAKQIPAGLRKTLKEHQELLGVPAVSPAELAMKDRIGRTQPDRPAGMKFPEPFRAWVSRALPEDTYEIVPLTPDICAEAFDLPGDFHRDPFDMMIVATARVQNLTLVTSDEAIRDYPHVRTVHFSPVRATAEFRPKARGG